MSSFIFSDNTNAAYEDGKITTFINHYSYLLARKQPELLAEFNEIHCDGIVLCFFLKLIGIKKERMSFDMTSLAPRVFSYAIDNSKSIYFIGGEPGIVESASSKFSSAYPKLNIAGCRNGYFNSAAEREKTLVKIRDLKPDYVIASMGTPYQEQFLVDLRRVGWSGQGYTSGGFFHQTAKAGLTYYPDWVNRLNLRWAYRIFDEPKLLRRYTTCFIQFIIFFTYDVLLSRFKRA